MFATPMEEYQVNPVAAKAINAFMILHMDHATGTKVSAVCWSKEQASVTSIYCILPETNLCIRCITGFHS